MMVIGLATADFESRHAVNNTDGGGTKKSESIRLWHPGIRGRDPCESCRF